MRELGGDLAAAQVGLSTWNWTAASGPVRLAVDA